ISFFAPSEGGLNYVGQYYNDKSSFSEAQTIRVNAGETISGIDAALEVGGRMTGEVRNGSSEGIAGIVVCALSTSSGSENEGCATTDSHGDYTISGLASDTYKVEFFSGSENLNYVTQYYKDKASLTTAEAVPVIAGET